MGWLQRATALLPGWPWYVWAGIGVGASLLLSAKRAAAATAPELPPAGPSGGTNAFGLSSSVPEREAQILSLVAAGEHDHRWTPLTWHKNGRRIDVDVSLRALALRRGSDRLVVSVSFDTAQKLADMLGGAMLTTRVADEIWKQAAVKLAPITRSWNTDQPVTGTSTARMIEQSDAINAQTTGSSADLLTANEGKDWVVTRRFWLPPEGTGVDRPAGALGSRHNAANFGWYLAGTGSKSPGGEQLIQSVGLAHPRDFVDYSQLLRLVRRDSLRIDGAAYDWEKALRDPELSVLLQDEGGTLPGSRHPDLA